MLKLQTKIKLEDAYSEVIGGFYNSMLDGEEEYLLENKEVIMDVTKLMDCVYENALYNLKSFEKNMKFDGKDKMMQYISNKIINDVNDISQIQAYVKSL